jgi:uncharacterized protein YaiI (UPF0178 family)
MKVLADADSLQPEIRALLARRHAQAAARSGGVDAPFGLFFVAARRLPLPGGAELLLVDSGPDAADDRLVELAEAGDLAVTRDLPLAERLAMKGVIVINDRGAVFTEANVMERRSLRDSAAGLRALGLAPESPRGRTWGPRELKGFADAFDRELTRLLRAAGGR